MKMKWKYFFLLVLVSSNIYCVYAKHVIYLEIENLCEHLGNELKQDERLASESILRLSKLAKNLVESVRHVGSLNAEQIGDFKKQYDLKCKSVFGYIKKKKTNSNSTNWSPENDAREIFEFLLSNIDKNKSEAIFATVLSENWFYYNLRNKNRQASIVAREAIDIFERLPGYENELAIAIVRLVTVLKRYGAYADNRLYLSKAISLLPKLNKSSSEDVLFSAGFLYRDLGDFELAERYFNRILDRFRQTASGKVFSCDDINSNSLVAGMVLTQLGFISREKSDNNKALELLQCASKVLDGKGDYYEILIKIELAKIYLSEKEANKTRQLLNKVLLDSRIQPPQLLDSLLLLFNSQIGIEDNNRIKDTIERIIRIFRYRSIKELESLDVYKVDFPIYQIEFFRLLIKYSKQTKDFKKIEIFYNKSKNILDKVKEVSKSPQAWGAAKHSFVETYVDTILNWNVENKEEKILDALEAFYSLELFNEKNLYNLSYSGVDEGREFSNWVYAKKKMFTSNNADFKKLLEESDDAYEIFYLKRNSSRFKEEKLKLLGLRTALSKMTSDEAIVRYFISDKNSFFLLLTKNAIKLHKISSKDLLVNEIQEIIDSDENINWSKFKTSKILNELLPVKDILSKGYTKLIVIPDSVLHHIPFSAINIEKEPKHYKPLANKVNVIRTYSIKSYFQRSIISPKWKPKSIAVFAYGGVKERDLNNAFAKYPTIPRVLNEVYEILKQKFWLEKTSATGEDASASFLLNYKTRNAQVLHIATHGFFDQTYPELVGIMGYDRTNKSREIIPLVELMSRPFNSQLVVISGCNTMKGKLFKGSGVKSLTRGFLVQGASSVVGTLWPVHDQPTEEFMKQFYTNLDNTNGDILESIHLTKKGFSSKGRYRHPKYWSGFVLTAKMKSALNMELHEQGSGSSHELQDDSLSLR